MTAAVTWLTSSQRGVDNDVVNRPQRTPHQSWVTARGRFTLQPEILHVLRGGTHQHQHPVQADFTYTSKAFQTHSFLVLGGGDDAAMIRKMRVMNWIWWCLETSLLLRNFTRQSLISLRVIEGMMMLLLPLQRLLRRISESLSIKHHLVSYGNRPTNNPKPKFRTTKRIRKIVTMEKLDLREMKTVPSNVLNLLKLKSHWNSVSRGSNFLWSNSWLPGYRTNQPQ